MSAVADTGTSPLTEANNDDAEAGNSGEVIVDIKPKGEMHWVMVL